MHSPLEGPVGAETLFVMGAGNGVVVTSAASYTNLARSPSETVVFTSAVAFAEWAKRHFDALMRARANVSTGPGFAVGAGAAGANKASGT